MSGALSILGIIPARFGSQRLHGKPLMDIGGKSMIQRVLERVQRAKGLSKVVVATDDQRILEHVQAVGGQAVLTAAEHPSGTDRCWEALQLQGAHTFDAVVNIQGDEPFIEPDQVDRLCNVLTEPGVSIATLAQRVDDDRTLDDPSHVLLTVDRQMNALYFSRAAIPFLRNPTNAPRHTQFPYLKHVGLYGYSTQALERIVTLAPSALERAESLEQLRWLEHGCRIRVAVTPHHSFSVDTPADLEAARKRAGAHR